MTKKMTSTMKRSPNQIAIDVGPDIWRRREEEVEAVKQGLVLREHFDWRPLWMSWLITRMID